VSRWSDRPAVLGKVEWEYEFLRGSQLSASERAFDEWLFRNVSACDAGGPDGQAEPPIYGFVARVDPADRSDAVVAGVISPSRDRAGRAYPAAVVTTLSLEEVTAHPEVLPILLEGFWKQAIETVTWVRSAPIPPDDPRLDALVSPLESSVAALELYRSWTERTSCAEFCRLLDRSPCWFEGALSAVAQAVRPARGGSPSSAAGGGFHGVRVPLGEAGGAALCLWLDVVWRTIGRRGPCPSFFWSHDALSGDALVSLPASPDLTLRTLWRGPSGVSPETALSCGSPQTRLSSASPSPNPFALDLTRSALPAEVADAAPGGPGALTSLAGGDQGSVAALLEMVG
jgi:hypothetical protein